MFGLLEGSDPSGGGPIAGRELGGSCAGFDGGVAAVIVRCNSIRSPFSVPEYILLPVLKET
jgi:hypothetical protein